MVFSVFVGQLFYLLGGEDTMSMYDRIIIVTASQCPDYPPAVCHDDWAGT